MIENMVHTSTAHEVLAVVFQVRHFDQAQTPELAVLLWQRALDPHRGAWALPGGRVRADEDLPSVKSRDVVYDVVV
ncbi:Uncharacterised protein [Mycobacteroides abscessus subsp. abscessus]|nr:Uncharacterised protein [Mycobacteroides abscessus subsp. abscessus]SHT22360.1 Uncharacterised protein [Mycobacteroides abscessus subsp. abscessus]SHT47431.1 Uncharacterised protein [Mycobacteroides abscessus subsp. abscessus]SHU36432.1 Uncharacterised protein [Mycobacteroides abscessus subsp. abscessus]SHV44246.1 Uncharacterised protein [Mycobacteroides abscessus subsp. abscessus]